MQNVSSGILRVDRCLKILILSNTVEDITIFNGIKNIWYDERLPDLPLRLKVPITSLGEYTLLECNGWKYVKVPINEQVNSLNEQIYITALMLQWSTCTKVRGISEVKISMADIMSGSFKPEDVPIMIELLEQHILDKTVMDLCRGLAAILEHGEGHIVDTLSDIVNNLKSGDTDYLVKQIKEKNNDL